MANTAPFEILAGAAEVWAAAVATAFPLIDDDPPGGAWDAGFLGRTEGGVSVVHNQSTVILRLDQETGPQKIIRPEEELHVTFNIAEITLERYARLLNDITVNTTAAGGGEAGFKEFNIRQGFDVAQFALLIRGPSPYMDALIQYELPRVSTIGEPSISYVKDDKAMLAVDFVSLEDENAATPAERFGRIIAQHEVAV
jgi:hypothetical protein